MVAERAFSHFDQQPVHDHWRHTRRNPCPVCTGGDDDKRGRGVRCFGKTSTSADGRQWTICTREEHAGALAKGANGYTHLSDGGVCKCGEDHRETAAPRPAPRPERATPAKLTRAHLSKAPDEVYDAYRALESGEPLRKLRYGSGKGKRFVWQRPDDAGDWRDCSGDRPTPDAYRAAMLEGADPFEPLAITEGEKDADKVAHLGWQLVISPPDGVGSWRDEYSRCAAGRHVVIFADQDADGKGQKHAAEVAASVASVAASVRVVTLEGTHDVGDWIDAGHTFAELRALSAAARIITAQLPPSLNSNPASQDDTPSETPKSCPNCQRWQDRARIAETTVATLRQEQAWSRRVLAMPKEQLSPALKPAAIAVREILSRPKARDEAGMEPVYRAAVAQRCGVSDQTASAYLRDLAKAGIIRREVVKSFDTSEIRIGAGPLFDEPEKVEEQPKTWGGRRVKTCTSCGSENLETRIVCRDCGAVVDQHDTNKPEPPDDHTSDHEATTDTQDEGQEYSPPLSLIVHDLASPDAARADAGSWYGGPDPECVHDDHPRRSLKNGQEVCGHCGARYVPALDSAEVRTLTERSIG